jgi:hypothetical protein
MLPVLKRVIFVQNQTMKPFLSLGLLLAVFISCKHEIAEIPAPPPGTPTGPNVPDPSPQGICFESEVLPLLLSNCAMTGCHSASNPAEGIALTSYASLMNGGEDNLVVPGNANASELIEVLLEDDPDKRMPRPPAAPLTQAQIDLLKQWINEGAQNTLNCAGCDSTQFTFAADVRPLLQSACVGCHSGTFPGGGVPLSTFEQIQTVALNGRLWGAVDHQQGFSPMPKNSAKLSACELAVIRKWIQAGAQNN